MDLKPCPFCGSPARLEHMKVDAFGDTRMVVTCTGDGCGANIQEFVGDNLTVERVVAAWNRRSDERR